MAESFASFQSLVASVYDFLVREHGYQRVDRSDFKVGEFAEYRKDPISITIGWYKGEIDVNFTVALDFAADHTIFRPFRSRMFALWEIATRENPAAYASLSARMKGHGYITNLESARAYLEESARIMKRFCTPILQGDFKQLEAITLARAGPR
jgi:hypothetical protein